MKKSTPKRPQKAARRSTARGKSTSKRAVPRKVARKKVARRKRVPRAVGAPRLAGQRKRAGCRIVHLKTGEERPVTRLSIRKRECVRWNSQGGAFRVEFLIWPFCEASDRVMQTSLGRRFVIDVSPGRQSNKFTIHIPKRTTYTIVALGPGVSSVRPPSTGPAVVGGD